MQMTIPEMTIEHIGLLALALVIGLVLGWFFRGERSAKEKIAVNAGWQDQLESQQAEQDRLAEQNKGLMEQISQYQASHQDSINRAKELSDSVRESLERRKELEQQIAEFRTKLEATVTQRDQLKEKVESQEKQDKNAASGLKEKDDKIFHLSRELTSWQSRVPPLVEKFQERDKKARELEEELAAAMERIEAFEEMAQSNQTRIEPVDAGNLPEGLDASNEPHSDTSANVMSELEDQIDDNATAEAEAEAEAEVEAEVEAEMVPADVEEPAAADNELLAAEVFVDEEDKKVERPDTATRRIIDEDADSADHKDDLQQIKGVGPAIEKTLNELGIFYYNQIAEMSEYEIDRVAQRLKGFRSRIYRQDWIGQARDLHYQKSNNLP
jgi:predicted flap endonuclease-1-like 5' DNA nuclease/cell division protein FtsB